VNSLLKETDMKRYLKRTLVVAIPVVGVLNTLLPDAGVFVVGIPGAGLLTSDTPATVAVNWATS
jgi:hypothetical protein